MFEQHGHAVVPAGRTARMRQLLPGGGEVEFSLIHVPRQWDEPGSTIKQGSVYLQPQIVNNPGWDAYWSDGHHSMLLQNTVSSWQGVKAEAVMQFLARLPLADKQRLKLVFVIPSEPPELFATFLEQPWLGKGKQVLETTPRQLQDV
jgi:hypothetical protein